uniref:MHC class I-like antigen recognition-like domain-containing protein n=1 Tax=Sparus aurata TaxID=8175 RepID=A0A671UK54_SPAAU
TVLLLILVVGGCEWDDETGEIKGFAQFGYDGEGLLELDLNTYTWIALRPEAVIAKLRWDADKDMIEQFKTFTQMFPEWLKKYVEYGRSILLRTGRVIAKLIVEAEPFLGGQSKRSLTHYCPERLKKYWRRMGGAFC